MRRKAKLLGFVCGGLMIAAGVFMFMQAVTGGRNIYLGFTSGISFEPAYLAAFLMFLAFVTIPFVPAALAPGRWRWLSFPLAAAVSLGVIFQFPLRFTADLWSDAYYADGTRMEGVKGTDVWFGYIPYWKSHFTDRNFEHTRRRATYTGNGYWGKRYRYEITMPSPERYVYAGESPEYECVTWETTHFFGYFWRDMRGGELLYMPEEELPEDKCTPIVAEEEGTR